MEMIIGKDRPMAAPDPVSDAGTADFEAKVLRASREAPVLAYFTASWCGPCKQFGPLLEKTVRGYGGKVRLVRIDIDKSPELAQMLRIQSVPAVFGFVAGRPVDGFMGGQPESALKQFIDRLRQAGGAGGAIGDALKQAGDLLAAGEAAQAAEIYGAVLAEEPSSTAAFAGMARALLALGELNEVAQMLADTPPELAAHGDIQAVRSALELARATQAGMPDTGPLEARLAANPDDHEARFDLAMAQWGGGQREAAVDSLLEIVRRNRGWNEEAARKQLVQYFDSMGPTDPLTVAARKRLSSILFS